MSFLTWRLKFVTGKKTQKLCLVLDSGFECTEGMVLKVPIYDLVTEI